MGKLEIVYMTSSATLENEKRERNSRIKRDEKNREQDKKMEAASPSVASLKDYEANPAANLRALEFSNPSAVS